MNFINGNKFKELSNGIDILYSKIDHAFKLEIPNYPFKFITHNGDLPITDYHKRILDSPYLIKWYGQNCAIEHPKLQPIPIGLDRSCPENIYTDLIDEKFIKVARNKLFYFRHWGDSMVKPYRDSVRDALEKQGFKQEPKRGITEYLIELRSSMFCPAPNGNGIDTHTLWECIYMGCVPIVEYNSNTKYFSDLPILLIDDWNNLPLLSESLYKEIRKKSLEKADFNYWKQLICS